MSFHHGVQDVGLWKNDKFIEEGKLFRTHNSELDTVGLFKAKLNSYNEPFPKNGESNDFWQLNSNEKTIITPLEIIKNPKNKYRQRIVLIMHI